MAMALPAEAPTPTLCLLQVEWLLVQRLADAAALAAKPSCSAASAWCPHAHCLAPAAPEAPPHAHAAAHCTPASLQRHHTGSSSRALGRQAQSPRSAHAR